MLNGYIFGEAANRRVQVSTPKRREGFLHELNARLFCSLVNPRFAQCQYRRFYSWNFAWVFSPCTDEILRRLTPPLWRDCLTTIGHWHDHANVREMEM
jgi:hypothetical protein